MAAIKITKDNFQSEVMESQVPVLVDFWASWCGPCKLLGPVIEEVADELEGQVKVGKINIDDDGSLAEQYNIMSIPTLLVFKNGEVINKSVGVITKAEILNLVK